MAPFDTGVYITLITFISFGSFLSDPGLSQTLIRNISADQNEAPSNIKHSLILSTLFWVVTWLTMIILVHALGYPDELKFLIAFGGLSLGFRSWSEMASAYIRAMQRMEIVALGNSLGLAMFSTLGIYFLSIGYGLVEITALLVLQGVFNFLFFWTTAIRLGLSLPSFKWNLNQVALFIKEVIPIALLAGSGIILNYVDIVMLSKLKGMSDTAIYGLAVKLINSLYLLSGSVLAALFPFFSSQWKRPNSEIYKAFKYSFKFFLIMGLISVATLSVLSEQVMGLFFGHNLIESADALFILIWAFLFSMLGAPLGILIIIEKKRITSFGPLAVGVVILNILLNLWLIPTYSYIGASISTLVCSVVLYFLKVKFVKTFFPLRMSFYRMGFKPLLATLSMAIVFWLTKGQGLALSLPFGGTVFLIILWVSGEFESEEYAFLNIQLVFRKWKKALFFLR